MSAVQVTSENVALNKDSLALGSSISLISVDNGWGSAWYEESVSLLSDWSTSFSFTAGGGSGTSDGFTFTINGDSRGLEAIGDGGQNLGFFGFDTGFGIQDSFAITFDMWVTSPQSLIGFSESSNTEIEQGYLNSATTLHNNTYDVVISYDSTAKSLNVEIGSQVFAYDIDLSQVVGESAYLGFSAANGGGTMDMTVQEWFIESSPTGESDPITGTFDGPGTVNLSNKGVTPFTLFGSDEINVSDIEVDSLIFGGEESEIGVTEKKNGSFFASYEDVNDDGELDLVVKVETNAFAGVAPTESFKVFGSLTDGNQVVFGLNEGDSINFI